MPQLIIRQNVIIFQSLKTLQDIRNLFNITIIQLNVNFSLTNILYSINSKKEKNVLDQVAYYNLWMNFDQNACCVTCVDVSSKILY